MEDYLNFVESPVVRNLIWVIFVYILIFSERDSIKLMTYFATRPISYHATTFLVSSQSLLSICSLLQQCIEIPCLVPCRLYYCWSSFEEMAIVLALFIYLLMVLFLNLMLFRLSCTNYHTKYEALLSVLKLLIAICPSNVETFYDRCDFCNKCPTTMFIMGYRISPPEDALSRTPPIRPNDWCVK